MLLPSNPEPPKDYAEHNFLRQSPEFDPNYRKYKTPWWVYAILPLLIAIVWTQL